MRLPAAAGVFQLIAPDPEMAALMRAEVAIPVTAENKIAVTMRYSTGEAISTGVSTN